MDQAIYQQEYPAGRILSEAWKRYKESFRDILILSVIVAVASALTDASNPYFTGLAAWDQGRRFILMFIVSVIGAIINTWAMMTVAAIVKNKIDGKYAGISSASSQVTKRLLPLIVVQLITAVFLTGLTLLLIIPGIIYAIYWVFVDYAVVFGKKSELDALKYSKSIVQGRWWRTFSRLFIFGLVTALVIFAAMIPYMAMSYFLGDRNAFGSLSMLLLFNFVVGVVNAYYSSVMMLFFLNFDATKKNSGSNSGTQEALNSQSGA